MSEVSTSRRAVMRALAILPAAIISPAAAHAAVDLTCSPAADARWLALLAEERRASAAFESAVEAQNHVYGQYLEALHTCEDDWQDRFNARRFPIVPEILGEAADAREVRVQAAVQQWNAEGEAFRNERAAIKPRLRADFQIEAADAEYADKSSLHRKTVKAIVAYPSDAPEIIAHKLRLLIREYGDEVDMLEPLLASITGENA